jgi:hypothetical protein
MYMHQLYEVKSVPPKSRWQKGGGGQQLCHQLEMWRRIMEYGEEKDKEAAIVAVREKAGEKLCLYFFIIYALVRQENSQSQRTK